MERLREIGAIAVSLLTGALVVWWLVLVQLRLGQPAIVQNGNVVLDEFQRAKDILIVVLPLFSAAAAYWLGSREVSEAKKEANEAKNQAAIAKRQLAVVLDENGKAFLPHAKEVYPDLFRDW